MSTANRQEDFISEARQHATQLWDSWQALLSLQAEWNGQDYGNTLADGSGDNEGVTAAQVGSVVFDTANAIKTSVMDIGHATNVTNILL